jgi:hypothetical protein
MDIATGPITTRSVLQVGLELSSYKGKLRQSVLDLGWSGKGCISAPAQLPPDIQNRCTAWYRHLQARSDLGQEGLLVWEEKHRELTDTMAEIVRNAVLPKSLRELLVSEFKRCSSESLLIGIRTDHEELDCLPLELLGHPGWGVGGNVVVWRCRGGQIGRKPVLRLLVIRSSPYNVPLPQNEEDVRAIATQYIHNSGNNHIQTRVLTNSTYDQFTGANDSFCPGVVHLATHGTLDSFQFHSQPYNDPMKYDSVARYFERSKSVTAVISTACFSGHPAIRGEMRGVCFADELIKLGVPAAIGMASKISPWAAQVFCERLYTELGRMRPMVEAYAEAVLAIRNMREEDKLLWSVPVMCAASSNVIPFPDRGYFRILAEMQDVVDRIENVRRRINRIPVMSRDDRIVEASGLSIDVAAIVKSLSDFGALEVPGDSAMVGWHEKLGAARTQLAWFKSETVNGLRQGSSAEQMASALDDAFIQVEQVISERYPVQCRD